MTIKTTRWTAGLAVVGLLFMQQAGFAQAWEEFGSLGFERSFHEVVVLRDGRILVAGGQANQPLRDCRIIDYESNTVTQCASMFQARTQFSMILMPDGKVYALGGYDQLFSSNPNFIECYDPATDTWSPVG